MTIICLRAKQNSIKF